MELRGQITHGLVKVLHDPENRLEGPREETLFYQSTNRTVYTYLRPTNQCRIFDPSVPIQ